MATRSLKEFQRGTRGKSNSAPLRVVEGGSTDPVENAEEQDQQAPPVSPDEGEVQEPGGQDAASGGHTQPEDDEAVWSEYCQRPGCRHAPCQHLEGECQVLGCDCTVFVYPPDVEDSGQHRLPGEGFARTEAEKQLHPLIRNLGRVRGVRLQANKDEKEAQDACLKIMKQHGVSSIVVDGKTWVLIPGKEKVKTSDKEDDDGGDGEPTLDLDD